MIIKIRNTQTYIIPTVHTSPLNLTDQAIELLAQTSGPIFVETIFDGVVGHDITDFRYAKAIQKGTPNREILSIQSNEQHINGYVQTQLEGSIRDDSVIAYILALTMNVIPKVVLSNASLRETDQAIYGTIMGLDCIAMFGALHLPGVLQQLQWDLVLPFHETYEFSQKHMLCLRCGKLHAFLATQRKDRETINQLLSSSVKEP